MINIKKSFRNYITVCIKSAEFLTQYEEISLRATILNRKRVTKIILKKVKYFSNRDRLEIN